MSEWEIKRGSRSIEIFGDQGTVVGVRTYHVTTPGGGPPPIARGTVTSRVQFHLTRGPDEPEIPVELNAAEAVLREGNVVTMIKAVGANSHGKREWLWLVLVNHNTRSFYLLSDCEQLVDDWLIQQSGFSAFFEPVVLAFAPGIVLWSEFLGSGTDFAGFTTMAVLWTTALLFSFRRRGTRRELVASLKDLGERTARAVLADAP